MFNFKNLFVVGLVVFFSNQAIGMYDAQQGRFLQQDPLGITPNAEKPNGFSIIGQYSDGLNLYQYVKSNPVVNSDPYGLWTEAAHRALGICGNGLFDYARLDRDFSAVSANYNQRLRHFRERNEAIEDAWDAARRRNLRDFEYHVHEVQDYYSHTAAGYTARCGHWWTSTPDDPRRNSERYRQAYEITRRLEIYWNIFNPGRRCE